MKKAIKATYLIVIHVNASVTTRTYRKFSSSKSAPLAVIPVKTGIQCIRGVLDTRLSTSADQPGLTRV